jgi:AcrR family transcriptional regulator
LIQQQSPVRRRKGSSREARAHRILDAAAVLILRWGYNKTTIDDIARQAGVAKGTIYLHWKTREDLFTALMTREKLEMADDLRQRIEDDPQGATLHGIVKHSALALMKRPLLKAVVLRDMDIVGKLLQTSNTDEGHLTRIEGFMIYLGYLRDHHLVRTDLSLDELGYIFSSVFTGFFLTAPMLPTQFRLSDDAMAHLLADTIHRALEPRHLATDELQAASRAFLDYVAQNYAVVKAQFEQQISTESIRNPSHEQ